MLNWSNTSVLKLLRCIVRNVLIGERNIVSLLEIYRIAFLISI